MDQILIIGAGPAGMACAMELYKHNIHFTVIEKDKEVGGLAKTYSFGNFRTDNGPHRFFSKNEYLYSFIEKLLGEKWIKVDRFTRFYVNGKFYRYPIEIKNLIFTMGLKKILMASKDFLIEKIRNRKITNFEEYAISNFGETLANFNMLNYTEKLWGIPCSQLSPDWAYQRIKGLTVGSILKKIFFKRKGPKTLVDQFFYPDLGTGLIYEAIRNKIKKKNEIILNDSPIKITHKDYKITKVILKGGKVFNPKHLISSIPIVEFVNLLNPNPPEEVKNTIKKIRFRSQVYLFLTINKPSITKDQWIYFPDKNVPFERISEMKNFSEKMSPKDKTSLFIEFFCWENDSIWNKSKEELFERAMPWLEKIVSITREDIIDIHLIKQKNVYPVYEIGYKENVDIIKNYLDKLSNLTYIGRSGRFRYTNQDHSLEMGITAAKELINGKKYDIEKAGLEQEYFEGGEILEKKK